MYQIKVIFKSLLIHKNKWSKKPSTVKLECLKSCFEHNIQAQADETQNIKLTIYELAIGDCARNCLFLRTVAWEWG